MKPKYQALKETLIEQIRAGAFAEEFPIPSEAELSAKYSVSRNTCLKKAIFRQIEI